MSRDYRALLLIAVLPLLGMAPLQAETAVHPLLQSYVDDPDRPLSPILRSSIGGRQGRTTLAGQEALDLHLRTTASRETLEALGIDVRTLRGGRATVNALPSQLAALARHPDIQSISLPRPLVPTLSDSTPDTGVDVLRGESGGVFSGATGSGVIVGVIDSGIDVDHENFMDDAGNTRILFALDQNTNVECTHVDIDGGTCPITDESASFGHGTHVTGIAAGNGAAPDTNGNPYQHVGMAPEADIIFVKSDFMTTGIIDGLEYIFDKADQLGMPAVVNLSLGSQIGAHDGTDSLEEAIDALVTAQSGRAVVVSAGNSLDDDIHAEVTTVQNAAVLGPAFSIDSYIPSPGSQNDVIQMVGYYPPTDNLTVHLFSPNGEHIEKALYDPSNPGSGPGSNTPCLPPHYTSDGYIRVCNNYQSQLDQSTSDREIVVLIIDAVANDTPAAGTWQMVLVGNTVAGAGEVDFWMFSRFGGSASKASFTTHVDDAETLNIPATSREAITVGAHITRTCWQDYNGNPQSYSGIDPLGALAPFSSAGPTRDGRTKPDLTAPGMGIISVLADEVRQDVIASDHDYLVVNDDYLLLQGTSQAAPHVTGAAALLFEQDPSRTSSDVKAILSGSAREDAFTALYEQSPGGIAQFTTVNYSFGAGKLDLGPWAWNDPYETNDQARNAHGIVSGQTLGGFIERAEDIDLFYLGDLASGDTVDIELGSLAEDYALRLQRKINLLGGCGGSSLWTSATSDNAGNLDESITYTASAFNLPRYLRVTSSVGNFVSSAPYDLRAVITRPEASGANDSISTAQGLPDEFEEFRVAGTTSNAADQDVYRFQVVGNGPISLDAPQRWVQLLSASGSVVANGNESLTYSPGFVFPGVSYTYYAVVSVMQRQPITGPYTLTVEH